MFHKRNSLQSNNKEMELASMNCPGIEHCLVFYASYLSVHIIYVLPFGHVISTKY